MEEEVWCSAALQMLEESSGPMHYTEIKKKLLEKGAVSKRFVSKIKTVHEVDI